MWTHQSKWGRQDEVKTDKGHKESISCLPADATAVKGSRETPLNKLKGQKQQLSLGGWHILRLGPGSELETEKHCTGSQHSIARQHQTNDSADVGTCPPNPPCGQSAVKNITLPIVKELEKNQKTFQANSTEENRTPNT